MGRIDRTQLQVFVFFPPYSDSFSWLQVLSLSWQFSKCDSGRRHLFLLLGFWSRVYPCPSLPVPQEAQEGGEPERGGSQSDCRFARPFLHAGESADVSRHADAAQLSGHARLKPCLRYHSPAPTSDSVHFMICFVFVLSGCRLVPLLISYILVCSFKTKKQKTVLLFSTFLKKKKIFFKNKAKHLGRRGGGREGRST